MMAAVGDHGDTVQFVEYISKNILLYKMRNGYELGPKAAAYFTRKNLADYLRTRYAYQVNLLVAGFDKTDGPQLTFIDYLANTLAVDHGTHGYGGMFCGSILDRNHYKGKLKTSIAKLFGPKRFYSLQISHKMSLTKLCDNALEKFKSE